MSHETNRDLRLVDRLGKGGLAFGAGCLLVGLGCLVFYLCLRLPAGHDSQEIAAETRVKDLKVARVDVNQLAGRLTGRGLLSPGRFKPTVQEEDTAQKLAERFKLQGVARIGNDMVAYVRIENQGVRAVRRGQRLMEFEVQAVEPGRLILSLNGSEVELAR